MNNEQIKQKLDALTWVSKSYRTIDSVDIECYGNVKLGGIVTQVAHTKGIMLIFQTNTINNFKIIEI